MENQERIRKAKAVNTATPASAGGDSDAIDRNADERSRVDDMRGSPMGVGNLEELIDDVFSDGEPPFRDLLVDAQGAV